MTNNEWINIITKEFGVSRTTAKEMLHCMMNIKKNDNFKKQINSKKIKGV